MGGGHRGHRWRTQPLDPKRAVFYSSGRASLEASYMYALFARLYGNNNLPDSSNMCHESTSVGLPLSIGVPVGTVTLPDFEKTDCLVFIGHNTGVNAPRMLHSLQDCAKRGVPIIVFNPLRERGFERARLRCCPARRRRLVRNIIRSMSAATRRRSGGMLSMTRSARHTILSEIDPFTNEDDLRVVIETPRGSRNKYSYDPHAIACSFLRYCPRA